MSFAVCLIYLYGLNYDANKTNFKIISIWTLNGPEIIVSQSKSVNWYIQWISVTRRVLLKHSNPVDLLRKQISFIHKQYFFYGCDLDLMINGNSKIPWVISFQEYFFQRILFNVFRCKMHIHKARGCRFPAASVQGHCTCSREEIIFTWLLLAI